MYFPAFLYGTPKEVNMATKKFIKKLKKNIEVFDIPNEEMINFNQTEMRIALGKCAWHGENIYVYHLFEEIYKTKDGDFISNCYSRALKAPWSLLCLAGGFTSLTQHIFVNDNARLFPYLLALNESWKDICSLGDVFMGLVFERKNIWTVMSNIIKVLALLGVPKDRLLDKEVPKDLVELVMSTN